MALIYAVCRADGRRDGAAPSRSSLLAVNPYLFGFNVFNMFQLGDLLAQLGLGAALLAAVEGAATPRWERCWP